MGENDKKPSIRFTGFTVAWEQRKVTEVGKIFIGLVTTMTDHYTTEGALLIRNSDIKDGRFEFGENPIFLERSFAQANSSRMHQVGDVITVHTGDVGTSAVIRENEEKSIGFATIVTRPYPQIIDSNYLCVFLNTEKHKKWAVGVSTGDGRTNYNLGDYNKCVIPIPSLEEQKKISVFIKDLNNLITLHQRKYEKLVIMKKSMLGKMFPQNGSDVPEIRFEGFTDPWEQRKLGELLSQRIEHQKITTEEPLLAFSYAEGVIDPEDKKSNKRDFIMTDKFNKIFSRTELNDIIYNPANVIHGAIHRNSLKTGVVSPIYKIFRCEEGVSPKYMGERLHTDKFINEITKYIEGTVIKLRTLSPEKFLDMEIEIPNSITEQDKIGEYFEHLDNLITLHQRKLEKLKNIKKSMLEKMFV